MVVEIGVSSIVLRLLTANKGVLSEGFVIFAPINLKSASNLNGNLNCSKELEHYAS